MKKNLQNVKRGRVSPTSIQSFLSFLSVTSRALFRSPGLLLFEARVSNVTRKNSSNRSPGNEAKLLVLAVYFPIRSYTTVRNAHLSYGAIPESGS